jgi:hypothetical protein
MWYAGSTDEDELFMSESAVPILSPVSLSKMAAAAAPGSPPTPVHQPRTSLLSAQIADAKASTPAAAPVTDEASLKNIIAAGRFALKQFLASRTAYDLMPPSGKVVVLDKDLRIKNAFEAMAEHGTNLWIDPLD